MAQVLHNRKNISAVLHCTANATFVIAGNNSVSNVATSDEVLTGAAIKQIWWGTDPNGAWIVKRGANVVSVHSGADWSDYAGNGSMLSKDASANVVVELVGSSNGYIMIELQKIGSFQSTY